MRWKLKNRFKLATIQKTTVLLLSVVFLFAVGSQDVSAQRKFSKTYPASKNIKLQLTNRSGTITVVGWDRNEVRISAWLEKPIAKIVPKNLSGTIVINVIRDNKGRGEVGSANFTVRVPYTSTVDIETVIGDLTVRNVRGGRVSAHITTDGDINLINIGAASVSAKNRIGDIFYDGLIKAGGIYRFVSLRGNINLRIPFKASFKLVATAPSSRYIRLGSFKNTSMSYVGDGRRVIGKVGTGSANLSVTNRKGTISLLSR